MTPRKHNFLHGLSLVLTAVLWAGAGGISVTFGTSGGPIVPPPPAPPAQPARPPFRVPAAVWEDQSDDIPNPNPYKAPTPPQLVHYFSSTSPPPQAPPIAHPPPPQTRYTHVVYTPLKPAAQAQPSISPARAFVNAYAPSTKSSPTVQASTVISQTQNTLNNEDKPKEENLQNIDSRVNNHGYYGNQQPTVPQLGVRYVPGYGFKYFTPEQDNDPRKYYKSAKYTTHDKYNALENNNIFSTEQHPADLDLTYDKVIAQRVKKSPTEVMIPQQSFNYYQQQLFFPINYQRH